MLNNIAMCLIKMGKLQRAVFVLDMIVGGKKPLDPTNFKAWRRQIEILISLGLVKEA